MPIWQSMGGMLLVTVSLHVMALVGVACEKAHGQAMHGMVLHLDGQAMHGMALCCTFMDKQCMAWCCTFTSHPEPLPQPFLHPPPPTYAPLGLHRLSVLTSVMAWCLRWTMRMPRVRWLTSLPKRCRCLRHRCLSRWARVVYIGQGW